MTNPNYTSSSLVGALIGYMLTISIYLMVYTNGTAADASYKIYVSLLLPAILSYTLIPLCHSIRSKIYYGLYAAGSNPLYIPNPQDVSLSAVESDQVNISL